MYRMSEPRRTRARCKPDLSGGELKACELFSFYPQKSEETKKERAEADERVKLLQELDEKAEDLGGGADLGGHEHFCPLMSRLLRAAPSSSSFPARAHGCIAWCEMTDNISAFAISSCDVCSPVIMRCSYYAFPFQDIEWMKWFSFQAPGWKAQRGMTDSTGAPP